MIFPIPGAISCSFSLIEQAVCHVQCAAVVQRASTVCYHFDQIVDKNNNNIHNRCIVWGNEKWNHRKAHYKLNEQSTSTCVPRRARISSVSNEPEHTQHQRTHSYQRIIIIQMHSIEIRMRNRFISACNFRWIERARTPAHWARARVAHISAKTENII